MIVVHGDLYYREKILIPFACVDVRILVEKWNVYGHIFPGPLLQTSRIKILLRTWYLCFRWFSFFGFWVGEEHVFQIVPFRPTRCVLKSFRCLEVSNRVRNWNKVKNNIYVWSKLQLCQLEIPIFINKLMCQSSLINPVSFVFCEFNRAANWNEGKTIILVRSSFQIPK